MLWWSCLAFDGRDAGQRPDLSGPEEVVVSADGAFAVHFTREGGDAPSGGDAADGIPVAVHGVLDGLTLGTDRFAAEGWRPLVGDLGVGGSDAIDVYVMDLDANGYANSVPGPDGDSCYMRVDGGLAGLGRILESVALHELHHCVEYRYGRTHAWVHEASATHAQYAHVLDPALELALGVLYGERLSHPERAMDDLEGRFEYAGFLVAKYWAERTREGDPLPDLWEALATHGTDWEAAFTVEAERRWGEALSETWLELATWNLFACDADDGQHYDSEVLPCVADVGVPVETWDGAPIRLSHSAAPYTAAYLSLPADGEGLEVLCDGDGRVRLVEVRADGLRGRWASDEAGTATLEGAEGEVVLVAVGDGPPLDLICEARRYALPTARGDASCGCRAAPGASGLVLLLLLPCVRRRRLRASAASSMR